jgi:protein-disulfide isomerase
MANQETETDPWVDRQITDFLLAEQGWQPDAIKARTALNELRLVRHARFKRWWVGLPLATSLAALALFFLPAPPACAQNPALCAERLWTVMIAGKVTRTDFKRQGSRSAPLIVEIYLDYGCPPCAEFFRDVLPQIQSEYVKTGKVQLVFRDLPNPRHRYADLAARYANAAGQLGYYPIATRQIFLTQALWSADGDVASHLASVLPADVMIKVRSLAANGATLVEDQASAQQDHINRTPSLVVVSGARRQLVPGDNTFTSVKTYLDSLAPR